MASPIDPATSYAELEISIDQQDDSAFLRMWLTPPDSEADRSLLARTRLDLNHGLLLELASDPLAYGRALGEMLVADPSAREGFARARASAESLGAGLRVLLLIDNDAPEIQALRWETLTLPNEEQPLALSDQVLLSRFVPGADMRPEPQRPRDALRALVVIAEPLNLEEYGLRPLEANQFLKRIQDQLEALADAEISLDPTTTTLDTIIERLSTGYDLFYLVAHGMGRSSEPGLLLTNSEGSGQPVAASEFAQRIARLNNPPQLMLIVSGQSNESMATTDQVSLGHQLIATGLPVVVETQAAFSLESAARFTSPFFRELQRDGQIDRAMAVARREIADQGDWWVPVLLTSLRAGRLWSDEQPQASFAQQVKGGGGQRPDAPVAQSLLDSATDPYTVKAPAISATDPYADEAAPAPPLEQADSDGPAAPVEQLVQEVMPDDPVERPPPPFADGPPPGLERVAPPPGPPATAQPPSIAVLVQRLEERYRPPDETLCIEIHAEYVHFRHHNVDYTSPHTLEEQRAELIESLALNPQRHGELLFAAIFRDAGQGGALSTRIGYEQALARADRELRVELNVYEPQFNRWRWEYLRDPNRPGSLPLATSSRSPLYRRPPIGRDPADAAAARPLKICAAICSPPGLGDPANGQLKGLAPIDIDRQEQIIRAALEPLREAGVAEYQILGGMNGPPASLETIGEQLDAGCHVLHLLAHGTVMKGTYYLVMEHARDDSPGPFVSADAFGKSLAARGAALRLVLLGACQSANAPRQPGGDDSLGAALVTGGVPAVIAMQDLVAVNTVQFFTQHFYADLARSGRVDMAVAATRYDLYEWLGGSGPDWGIPVLYMGPGDGRLFDLDIARVARRLPERAPDIKSFADPALGDGQIAQRVAEFVAAQPAGTLSPPQLDALRAAVAPGPGPDLTQLAPEQDRITLGRLRRPLAIDAAELQTYVESQPDRLVLDSAVYRQLAAALSIGKHIILTGPPGTGKTSVAQHICRFAAERNLSEPAVFTTASADWTTFDTVGGYVPTAQGTLQFRAGIFLRAIGEGRWLVIDEINRAEIDKAFGELFTVLSGQQVDLPYRVGPQQVRIIPGLRGDAASPWVPASVSSPYDYVVHPNWRIIGAMNVFDRSSLFALSFALMRRFAFIELDVPDPQVYRDRLIDQWLAGRSLPSQDLADLVVRLLEAPTLMGRRALGPAIIRDLVQHIAHNAGAGADLAEQLAEAFMLYAVPQLDALDQETIAAIYAELLAIFGSGAAAALMLGRVRGLYPHIRRDEWPQ